MRAAGGVLASVCGAGMGPVWHALHCRLVAAGGIVEKGQAAVVETSFFPATGSAPRHQLCAAGNTTHARKGPHSSINTSNVRSCI